MTFRRPRQPTRPPSFLGYVVSIVLMTAIVAGAYVAIIGLPSPSEGDSTPADIVAEDGIPEDLRPPDREGISRPQRITIPAIGVDGPVLEMRFNSEGEWDADSIVGEVGHLQGTAYPGEGSNAVLAAHVTVPEGAFGPFKDLHTMQPGQTISTWARDGTLYRYEVVENKTVVATALEVVAPTEEPTLTLLTCTGWDENQQKYLERIVIVAHLREITAPTS